MGTHQQLHQPPTGGTTSFFGTKDNQPLVIKTNNLERMRVAADGRVSVGFGGAIINGVTIGAD